MFIDPEKLKLVAQTAFDAVAGERRWECAIAKAKRQIEENPYMHFADGTLLVLSPSGNVYSAGRSCQCVSYLMRKPCWHRAAARLIQRYTEAG